VRAWNRTLEKPTDAQISQKALSTYTESESFEVTQNRNYSQSVEPDPTINILFASSPFWKSYLKNILVRYSISKVGVTVVPRNSEVLSRLNFNIISVQI
jgi:hypothetical protein